MLAQAGTRRPIPSSADPSKPSAGLSTSGFAGQEDVARVARGEERRGAEAVEPHRTGAGEMPRPLAERSRHERVNMVDFRAGALLFPRLPRHLARLRPPHKRDVAFGARAARAHGLFFGPRSLESHVRRHPSLPHRSRLSSAPDNSHAPRKNSDCHLEHQLAAAPAAAAEKVVAALDPDVICLQETKVPDALFPAEVPQAAWVSIRRVSGMKGYNGVAILSRRPIEAVSICRARLVRQGRLPPSGRAASRRRAARSSCTISTCRPAATCRTRRRTRNSPTSSISLPRRGGGSRPRPRLGADRAGRRPEHRTAGARRLEP